MMIKISKAKISEVEEIKKLLSHTWEIAYGKYYPKDTIDKITSSRHDKKLLSSQILDVNTYFAVAKENEKIIGAITVRKIDDSTTQLVRIYVQPENQAKGVGSLLMKEAFFHFPNIKKIRASCEKRNNSACVFYLKKGFKPIGEKDEIVEGKGVKTVEFEKKLD